MKLGINIVGDIARIMEAETRAGERAVTTAMRDAGTGLKSAWRAQITGAGLGARLARTIRSEQFPKGRTSLNAAVMRKLVILANALIRDDREWTKTAP